MMFDNTGIHEGPAMCLFAYFMKHLAAAALTTFVIKEEAVAIYHQWRSADSVLSGGESSFKDVRYR